MFLAFSRNRQEAESQALPFREWRCPRLEKKSLIFMKRVSSAHLESSNSLRFVERNTSKNGSDFMSQFKDDCRDPFFSFNIEF